MNCSRVCAGVWLVSASLAACGGDGVGGDALGAQTDVTGEAVAAIAVSGLVFKTNLSGLQETPPHITSATGFGKVVLDQAAGTMTLSMNWTGLSSPKTAGHIHVGPRGVAGAVAFDLGPTGDGATSGTITSSVFNVTPSQMVDLKAGLFYINIHSQTFPGGEIRGQLQLPSIANFDGDGMVDLAVWDGSQLGATAGMWSVIESSGGGGARFWGSSAEGDVIVPGDYDGDGQTDYAVWRAPTGVWYVQRSSDGSYSATEFGSSGAGDTPVPADYDGDGKMDLAVMRKGNNIGSYYLATWYIRQSSDSNIIETVWPEGYWPDTDPPIPFPADYDGDGKADIAAWRQQFPYHPRWYVRRSSDGAVVTTQWGYSGDTGVPADYDGDGKVDLAVWRGQPDCFAQPCLPAGIWYILPSNGDPFTATVFGASSMGDTPVPGDYDGDGKADLAVWRRPAGSWYVLKSSDGTLINPAPVLGTSPHLAVVAAYVQ